MDHLPNEKVACHRTGFTDSCRRLVADGLCNRWRHVAGHNPNTGEPINRYDCEDNWGSILLIENSQMQRQTAAAIESFRNEVFKLGTLSLSALTDMARLDAPPRPATLIESHRDTTQ